MNMISLDPERHSTYENSVEEYTVNMMESTDDPIRASKLNIQYGHSKFWVMIDSGTSTSIVTEYIAKDIEARHSNMVEHKDKSSTTKQLHQHSD